MSSTSAAAGSGGRVSPEPNGEFAAAPLSDMMAAVSEKVYEREAEENPPHECPARLVRSSDTGCPEHSVCSGLWAAEGADGQYYPVLMSTVGCEVWLCTVVEPSHLGLFVGKMWTGNTNVCFFSAHNCILCTSFGLGVHVAVQPS